MLVWDHFRTMNQRIIKIGSLPVYVGICCLLCAGAVYPLANTGENSHFIEEFNPQLAIEKATLNFSINPLRKLSSIEAEEYSFLDTEEFDISVERDDSSNTPGIRKEAHPAKTLPMPLMKPMIWTDISAGVFFLLILLYAMKGKADNKRMVDSWVKAFAPILAENFAARGFKDTYVRMRKWHQYEVFASGRRNCRNMHLAMNCIPRQCIWRHRLLSLIQKTEDVISIEITLDTLDTVTFALCRKRELNQVLNEYKELKTHCKVWKGELDHNFCVVAETSEVVEQILQSPPMKLFQSNSIYIDLIYISDRASEKNKRDSSKLCVVLKAPSIQKSMELQPLFRAVMALVDFAVNIRIPDKVRNNLKNKRNAIDTEAKMNSEDYQEQEEKKRILKNNEKREKLEKMTDEQKRKYEERQNKKQSNSMFKFL